MAHVTLKAAWPSAKSAPSLTGRLRPGRSRFAGWLDALKVGAARLRPIAANVRRLCTGVEIMTREERADSLADLAAARLDAARWKAETEACQARITELEREAAEARLVAMDLRARLVCLHGKLATTAATARYQSFASALEAGAPPSRLQ